MDEQMLFDAYDEIATDFYQTQLAISHLSVENPEKVEQMGNKLLDIADELRKVREALGYD